MITCCFCGKPTGAESLCLDCASKLERSMTIDLFARVCRNHHDMSPWPHFENFVLDNVFNEKQHFVKPTVPPLFNFLKLALEHYEPAFGKEQLHHLMLRYIIDNNMIYTLLREVKKD